MSRSSPLITSLNAGEFSPVLEGRADLAKYPQACKLIENFLLLVQGPAQRRGGSRYVTPIKDEDARAWLIRFEFNASQAFVLEFGDEYVRFYYQHAQLTVDDVDEYDDAAEYTVGDLVLIPGGAEEGFDPDAFDEGAFDPDAFTSEGGEGTVYYCIANTTGNAPPDTGYWYALTDFVYEIPSPYTLAAMTNADGTCALQVVQSADVLYLCHQSRTVPPWKLTRHANTRWIFTRYLPAQGPFLPENITAQTLQASAQTGSVTLTASSALFLPTDVGRLVRLQSQNLDVDPWETDAAYSASDLTRYDGKVYEAQNSDTSKTSPPIHERGVSTDGKNGVEWLYQHSGYGIARITAYTSATEVEAEVVEDAASGLQLLPANVVSDPTARWKLGAWSDSTEWPATLAFFKNRLHFGGRVTVWGTVPNDFENMSEDFFGEVTIDSAINEPVPDVNEILWMEALGRLVLGTGGGEIVVGPQTTQTAYGPGNISIVKRSKKRSRAIQPVIVGDAIVPVQRAGRKLLALNYDSDTDRVTPTDLAVLADRITRTGIIATAYQGEPHSIIWCVLNNGKLIGFTFDQEQNVTGWHRHPIGGGGFVESIATIPAPDGARDELWLLVRRTINGATRRYVEYFEPAWEGTDQDGTAGDDQADMFYLDGGSTFVALSPTTIVTGAGHLEGCTVQVVVDGAVHPDRTVSSGSFTLQRQGTKVQYGLQSVARLVPLKIESGANDGTAQGKMQRIAKLGVRVVDTLGGKVGLHGGAKFDDISRRNPSTPMGQAEVPFTGIKQVDFPGGWDRNGNIEIRQEQPLPMTIAAIMPIMYTSPE